MSLLHSQSGLVLVLSLLLLMVINYYYPATQSTADVMSPTSLGQREKKQRVPGAGSEVLWGSAPSGTMGSGRQRDPHPGQCCVRLGVRCRPCRGSEGDCGVTQPVGLPAGCFYPTTLSRG